MSFLMDLCDRVATANGNPPSEPTLASQVVAAQTKLTNAQAELQRLQGQAHGLPYQQRVQLNAAIVAQKQVVKDAEHVFNEARDTAAAARVQSKFRAQEQERANRREASQAQHALLEEASAKDQFVAALLQAGGTREQAESLWPAAWKKELLARTTGQSAATKAALKAQPRYSSL